MGRALKYLFRLAVLAALGLIAYAYLDELPPPTRSVEVELAVPPGDGRPPDPAPPGAGGPAPAPVPAPAPTPAQEGAGGVMQE